MIIEYDKKYDEQIKDLLVELQEHIQNIDLEGYNILTDEFRESYFSKTMDEIKKCNGKILLYKEENDIVGLVIGLINNENQYGETLYFKIENHQLKFESNIILNIKTDIIVKNLLFILPPTLR